MHAVASVKAVVAVASVVKAVVAVASVVKGSSSNISSDCSVVRSSTDACSTILPSLKVLAANDANSIQQCSYGVCAQW
jgi:hypothetical protein